MHLLTNESQVMHAIKHKSPQRIQLNHHMAILQPQSIISETIITWQTFIFKKLVKITGKYLVN